MYCVCAVNTARGQHAIFLNDNDTCRIWMFADVIARQDKINPSGRRNSWSTARILVGDRIPPTKDKGRT